MKKLNCELNTVFVKKAYMKIDNTYETVLALDNNAMVLTDEIVKMFWLRNAE